MKLIIAVVRDNDSEPVSHALISNNFRVTRIASTGGFLRKGSTTLMIGVADDQVDAAIDVIRESTSPPADPGIKRATLFVLPVTNFVQV